MSEEFVLEGAPCPMRNPNRRLNLNATSLALQLRGLEGRRYEKISWMRPARMFISFVEGISQFSKWLYPRISRGLALGLVSLLILILAAFVAPVEDARLYTQFRKDVLAAAWWISIGFFTSLGLGSGLFTGLAFIFPHLYAICASAQRCGNVNIDWRETVGFLRMYPFHHFQCDSGLGTSASFTLLSRAIEGKTGFDVSPHALLPSFLSQCTMLFPSRSSLSFWGLLRLSLPAPLLWGLGTALGNLPAFIAARVATRVQPMGVKEFEDSTSIAVKKKAMLSWFCSPKFRIACFTSDFIYRRGALGVFLLSLAPVCIFDLVPILSGAMTISFTTFFLTVWLSRGFLRIIAQTALTIFIFSEYTDGLKMRIVHEIATFPGVEGPVTRIFGSPYLLFRSASIWTHRIRMDDSLWPTSDRMAKLWEILLGLLAAYTVATTVRAIAQLKEQMHYNHFVVMASEIVEGDSNRRRLREPSVTRALRSSKEIGIVNNPLPDTPRSPVLPLDGRRSETPVRRRGSRKNVAAKASMSSTRAASGTPKTPVRGKAQGDRARSESPEVSGPLSGRRQGRGDRPGGGAIRRSARIQKLKGEL